MIRLIRFGIFLITTMSTTALPAQKSTLSLGALFGVQTQGKMKWASMDRFIDSYNLNVGSKLTAPVEYLRLNPGFVWGIEAQMLVAQFGYTHTGSDAKSVAILKNGEKREFELDSRANEVYMTMAFPTDFFDIGFNFGGVIYKGELRSSYIYADGFRSYGEDKALNGIFDLGSHMDVTLGPRVDFGYKWIKFSFRAEYQGVFSNMFGSLSGTPVGYRDLMMSNVSASGTFNDGQTHHYLPEDWTDQVNPSAYFVSEKPTVSYGYKGWKMTFLIRIAPLYKSE